MKHFIKICTQICIVTGLSLFLSMALQAGTYKWTDEKGNVHYTQRPPPGKPYEKMKIEKPSSANSSKPAPAYSAPADDVGAKTVKAEEAKNAAILKQNCQAAKNNLNLYQVHNRIRDAQGNIRFVSPKEREEKMATAKDQIREFCK